MEIQKFLQKIVLKQEITAEEIERMMQIISVGGASSIHISSLVTSLTTEENNSAKLFAIINFLRRKIPYLSKDTDVNISVNDNVENKILFILVSIVIAEQNISSFQYINSISQNPEEINLLFEQLAINTQIESRDDLTDIIDCGFLYSNKIKQVFREISPVLQDLMFHSAIDLVNLFITPTKNNIYFLGSPNSSSTKKILEILKLIEAKKAWIVSNPKLGGVIANDSESLITIFDQGKISEMVFNPSEYDFNNSYQNTTYYSKSYYLDKISSLHQEKQTDSLKDLIILNSAALFVLTEKSIDFHSAITLAREIINNKFIMKKITKLVEITNS